jgi:7-carboxy-7-deazaguanine synthase
MCRLKVVETFESIQGESSWAGMPCFFIRLAGCNLRCVYCDTPYAYEGGEERSVEELVAAARASRAPIVEITGGEPLLQEGLPALAAALRDGTSKRVLVETNGSLDLARVPPGVVAIVDIKCPGSGESERVLWSNVERLRACDEVKFVISDRADYDWAVDVLRRFALATRCRAVHLSPAADVLGPAVLAGWMLADGLPARLQVQLHKVVGLK